MSRTSKSSPQTGRSNAHVQLVTKTSGWLGNPPTPAQVREQLAKGYPQAHGQVLAAAYIAHAYEDTDNHYTWGDLWHKGHRESRVKWIGGLANQRTDHWSIWWWRRMHHAVWSNTRQWVMFADNGCIVAVHLDYEVQHDTLFKHDRMFLGVDMPVRMPVQPSTWFDYMWRKVPGWKSFKIDAVQKVTITDRTGDMKPYGVVGQYVMVNGDRIISEKQLKVLTHPLSTSKMRNVKLHQARNWLASTCDNGIAMVALRHHMFMPPYRLEDYERLPKGVVLR